MFVQIILSSVLLVHVKTDDLVEPYHEVAFTTSGAPCIGGCSPDTHQCVASWPPKNEPCVLHDALAPRFRTTQTESKHRYCLSNCGYFEWETAWCFVTSYGKWDNCIAEEQREKGKDEVLPYTTVAYTKTGKPCIGGCSPDTHQCVAHYPPKNEPCVLYNKPGPKFKTTRNSTCISNCGAFAWPTPWCYVSSDGEFADCVLEEQQSTTEKILEPSLPPLALFSTTEETKEEEEPEKSKDEEPENSKDEVLPYTTVAYTKARKPCIGGCSPDTHQCVAHYPPKNEPCVLSNKSAPKFNTTQNSTCISNCGAFAWSTPWCYVTRDGEFADCVLEEQQSSTENNPEPSLQPLALPSSTEETKKEEKPGKNKDKVLPYTTVAYTKTGKPCIGGCSPDAHQCVAHYPPKNEPCVLSNKPAPKFNTTQNSTCISNCGAFAWSTPWCYVTSNGEFADCILEEQQSSTEKNPEPSIPPLALPSSTEETKKEEKPEKNNDKVLSYTTVAYTKTGKPCIGGCSPDTHQCVAHYPPKNEPCVLSNKPAPKFNTTQNSTCISNCGAFAWPTPWCYVSSDGEFADCVLEEQQSTTEKILEPSLPPLALFSTTEETKKEEEPEKSKDEEPENSKDKVLPYTTVAYTKAGKPCIGGCSPDTHQCVAHYPPKNEPCVLSNKPAPKFNTTQNSTCISNCGAFAWSTPWCYVTSNGEFADCILEEQQSSTEKNPEPSIPPLALPSSTEETKKEEKPEKNNDKVLSYTTVAYTKTGKPCIGGCSPDTHQCVAHYPPKNEPCVLSNKPAPKFNTTQNSTCISNCGAFAWSTPWCYVTSNGEFADCILEEQQSSTEKNPEPSIPPLALPSSTEETKKEEKPEKNNDKVLSYTTVAYTKTGKPCIGGCSPDTHQCVAHYPPKNEPCVLSNKPAPKFNTTQNSTCISNCGAFAWSTPWCYVTSNGEFADCILEEQQSSTEKNPEPSIPPLALPSSTEETKKEEKPEKNNDKVLSYTTVAYTKTGKPCIGGCSPDTHQCVAHYPPKNEPCVLSNKPAPKFNTTQNSTCISNCGAFAWPTPWCYVSGDGEFADCVLEEQQSTTEKILEQSLPPLALFSTTEETKKEEEPEKSKDEEPENSKDKVLPYTTVAYTKAGKPCIGGCSPDTHQCVAHYPPKNEPCVLSNKPAPKFNTTQNSTCISNCGAFALSTPWCYVTSDGDFADCVLEEQQSTTEKIPEPSLPPFALPSSTEETKKKEEPEKNKDKVLPYTTVAYTKTGKPCIGGCSPDTHQCVAHYPPKNEPCVLSNKPAPKFNTTQNSTCISNCGAFAWSTPWCYVNSDGEFADCVLDEQQSTTEKIPLPSLFPLVLPSTTEVTKKEEEEYEYEYYDYEEVKKPKHHGHGPRPFLFDVCFGR